MLKLLYYRHNKNRHTVAIPPQQINFYSLTFILKGEVLHSVNGIEMICKAPVTVFMPPKTVRARPEIRNVDYINFNFTSDEIYELPFTIHDTFSNTLQALLLAFDNIYNEKFNLSDERLSLLLECILKQLQQQNAQTPDSELVHSIKRHVKERISEKISLAWISKFTFFSVSYCEYAFKKETGMSITDYILHERIALAKRLILENHYSLKEIATMVGFNDYNYFSRTFKKRTGYTPTEFVKQALLISL